MSTKKETLIYLVAHNHNDYLKNCVSSILEQIDSHIDLILIDSGSSDGSDEYLKQVAKEHKLEFFQRKEILTKIIDWVYAKFSKKYDFIMRLDGDDALNANALKILISEIKNDAQIGSVSGSWIEVNGESEVINKVILENGIAQTAFHGACTLFRTESLSGIQFSKNKITSQDGLYTWLKIKNKWECKTIKEIIFQYRRHENNMSNNEANLFKGRKAAYFSIFQENLLSSNSCVIIGYQNTGLNFERSLQETFKKNLERQLAHIEKSESVKEVFLSSNINIFDEISIKKYKKLSILDRKVSSKNLLKSLQECKNLEPEIVKYDDLLILNPLKNIWPENIIDIAVYSKYIHGFKSMIACDVAKTSIFKENSGELSQINIHKEKSFSSDLLFIRKAGFLLIEFNDFYKINNEYPQPVGHVSNNFLTFGIDYL